MRHRACGGVGCVVAWVISSTFGTAEARADEAVLEAPAAEAAVPVIAAETPLAGAPLAGLDQAEPPVVLTPALEVDGQGTGAPGLAESSLAPTATASNGALHLAPLVSAPPDADLRDEHGLLGQARIGLLAGVGLSSRPVNLLALARIHRTVSVGAEYKLLPPVSVSDATVSAYSVGGDLRVFPFGGAFFFGASGGYQALSVAAGTGAEAGTITSSSIYASPRLGCLWNWDFGLALGVDVGVTIPIAPQTVVNSPIPLQQIEDTARTLGKAPLPEISLLRIGMLM